MARSYRGPVIAKHSRFGHAEEESEEVRGDALGSRSATLCDDAILLGAPELIHHALERLAEREKLIDDLLRRVPREYEEKIKALRAPLHRAQEELVAAQILIENSQAALGPLEKKEERS